MNDDDIRPTEESGGNPLRGQTNAPHRIHVVENHNRKAAIAPPPTRAKELTQSGIALAPSPDEVARRAYFSYLNEGSIPGREEKHWLEAEAQLIAEMARAVLHSPRASPAVENGQRRMNQCLVRNALRLPGFFLCQKLQTTKFGWPPALRDSQPQPTLH
jgi:hypothetical protein